MTTARERLVILFIAVIVSAVLLWAFVQPYREAIGNMVIMPLGTIDAHDAPITAIALSSDGKILATAAKDFKIKLWDWSEKRLIRTLTGHKKNILRLKFTPDGKYLVSASADMSVKMWDVMTGNLVRQWDDESTVDWHNGWIQAIAISADGKFLATGSRDTTIKVWDLANGELLRTLWGHTDTVTALAFHPKEKNLLASGSTDGSVWIWDLNTGKPQYKHSPFNAFDPYDMEFSPDGKFLALGSYASKGVRVIDWQKGKIVAWGSGIEGSVWDIAFSPDGRLVAAGAGDNACWIYDITKTDEHQIAERLRTIRMNVGRQSGSDIWGDVKGVAFTPDGKILITAMEDGKVRMWRITGIVMELPKLKLPSLPDSHGHEH
ncbi:MAG: WD40 repeat domain-containing protein [Armatimonadetes bacterium]|nr:WD40 repeat domain-containing protein [Armatimonadota bacterium]MDW8029362.1 WD40 repeat domain-containing protein [Armatimonadota bacterium]